MAHLQQTVLLLRFEFALYAVRETVWVLTLVFALYAGWSDFRTRRIPNWLTVSGLVVGLAVNAILEDGMTPRYRSRERAWHWACCFRWCCCAGLERETGS